MNVSISSTYCRYKTDPQGHQSKLPLVLNTCLSTPGNSVGLAPFNRGTLQRGEPPRKMCLGYIYPHCILLRAARGGRTDTYWLSLRGSQSPSDGVSSPLFIWLSSSILKTGLLWRTQNFTELKQMYSIRKTARSWQPAVRDGHYLKDGQTRFAFHNLTYFVSKLLSPLFFFSWLSARLSRSFLQVCLPKLKKE